MLELTFDIIIISCVKVKHIDPQTESIKLRRLATTRGTPQQWISELRSTFNFVKMKKKRKKTRMLPYYPSTHDLLLHQCCTQNGKRSIKGSLLTSRFCKCYGLVSDSWRSSVFNCSCNSNVNWLHERKSERKWKGFQRKTPLKSKKKWNTSCLKHTVR